MADSHARPISAMPGLEIEGEQSQVSDFRESTERVVKSRVLLSAAVKHVYTSIHERIYSRWATEPVLLNKIGLEDQIRSIAGSYRLMIESQLALTEDPADRLDLELTQAEMIFTLARLSMTEAVPCYAKAYQQAEKHFDKAYFLRLDAALKMSLFSARNDGDSTAAVDIAMKALEGGINQSSDETANLVAKVKSAIDNWESKLPESKNQERNIQLRPVKADRNIKSKEKRNQQNFDSGRASEDTQENVNSQRAREDQEHVRATEDTAEVEQERKRKHTGNKQKGIKN